MTDEPLDDLPPPGTGGPHDDGFRDSPEDEIIVDGVRVDGSAAVAGRSKNPLAGLVVMLVAFGIFGLIVSSVVTVAIWPGEIKLTAPLFCPEHQPDPFVVSDTYTSGGETTTNFTLYCMGERGDVSDQGFARPFLLLSAVHGGILWLLATLSEAFGGRGHLRRTRGGPQDVAAVQDVIVPDVIADQ